MKARQKQLVINTKKFYFDFFFFSFLFLLDKLSQEETADTRCRRIVLSRCVISLAGLVTVAVVTSAQPTVV